MGTCSSWWNLLTRVRNAEVRGSTPLCSTNRINDLGQGGNPAFFICHRFVTWSNRFHQIFNCSALRLVCCVCVAQSHSDVRPSEDFSQRERICSVRHPSGGRGPQVVKAKISDSCYPLCLIEPQP